MKTPNIFKFATSELSQDAVLAYMLDWANPAYRADFPEMNKLGEDFLRALLCAVKADRIESIEKLVVKTQDNRIDVSVEINDKVFLIIEDKTETGSHSRQIKRYTDKTKKEKSTDLSVFSVYIKTGNETKKKRSKYANGYFYRKDLLKVLDDNPSTGNNIIGEFKAHLQKWESRTQSFKDKEPSKWSWSAHEGYYLALEEKFGDQVSWGYAANPAGGSLVLWWTKNHEDKPVYLQIDQHKGLFIRAYNNRNDRTKVETAFLRKLLGEAKHHAGKFDNIHIEKPARLSPGKTASFAKICFDGNSSDGSDSYMAKQPDGTIDLEGTVARLKKANEFVQAMCDKQI